MFDILSHTEAMRKVLRAAEGLSQHSKCSLRQVIAPRRVANSFLDSPPRPISDCQCTEKLATGCLILRCSKSWILSGIGEALRIYAIGQKLLWVENKDFPSAIVPFATQGSCKIIGDMQVSILLAAYKEPENRLLNFADDSQPHWNIALIVLHCNLVVASDRLGSVLLNYLDCSISDLVEADSSGAAIVYEISIRIDTPYKTKMPVYFYVGALIAVIQSLACCRRTGGSVNIVDLLSALEHHMRTEQDWLSPIGRDQMSWRGYYVPVKESATAELDRAVGEVAKKLEQLRLMASDVYGSTYTNVDMHQVSAATTGRVD
ncbi:unnamed protein product [Cyclocybe aegerita]|uniref:RSE1/DDB1/CPSF1 C-terminal domain-containing protein n=1 Tax=Cyclocybe aegerita TaxID=1973307 RepID=A0A8S0WWS9_CYCAE|nr:unnamed protein product [Cyclocybe aegerita]